MKTAVITGASRGVGKAAAEKFALDGWRLILNCREKYDKLDEVAKELSELVPCYSIHGPVNDDVLAALLSQNPAKHSYSPRYLSSSSSMSFFSFKDITSSFKELKNCSPDTEILWGAASDFGYSPSDELLLINNAGVSKIGLLQDMSDAEVDFLLGNNLRDMISVTRAIIPYMLKEKKGRIINISSVWGVRGAAMESVYSLTKGGVNAFTEALARELAPSHIPVNALALGAVNTDMNAWMSMDELSALEAEIPYGRLLESEEAAEMLSLIASSPRYLTGQIIRMDGGWV